MVARQTSWKKKTMIYFTNQSEENSKWKFPPTDPDSSWWLLHDYDVLISRISRFSCFQHDMQKLNLNSCMSVESKDLNFRTS